MPISLARPLIRSVLDPSDKRDIIDAATGATWKHYEGDPLGLEFVIAAGRDLLLTDAQLYDVSGLSELAVEVRAETAPTSGPDADLAFGSATVFNAGLTAAQWIAGTGSHCLIELSSAEAGVLPAANYHVGITVTPTVGEPFTIAVGKLQVIADRAGGAPGVPADGLGVAITLSAADVRYPRWFPSVTGYTGGTGANLDGVPTAPLAIGTLAQFVHATEGMRSFVLKAGTTATDGTTFATIRGTDYAAGTNEKFWQSV